MRTWLAIIGSVLVAAIVVATHARTASAQSLDEPDFAVPNGHFYSQAAPGQRGAGYLVANAAGIPLLAEFERQGGLGRLGYPVSRRFVWKGSIAQAFQFGVLVWLADQQASAIVSREEVGSPPPSSRPAELPPRFAGEAQRAPWSGWWWPANYQAGGARMFDPDGPLARYDQLAQSLGRPDPATTEWERTELFFADFQWAGHCNGWAAASLLEPEPTETREINGIAFGVAEQKGLLSAYHFADGAFWGVGGDEQPLGPSGFHTTLRSWIGEQRRGLIMTFRLAGEEVWSYPAFKFESVMGPDPLVPDLWQVRTTVWLADNNVAPGFVGLKLWPDGEGKVFEYSLVGDPNRPRGGEWASGSQGRFERPFMLWYPDHGRRNAERQLVSPDLSYELILGITRGSVDRPAFAPRRR